MDLPVSTAVILVGHGGVPRDYPRERLKRLRALEAQQGGLEAEASAEATALENEIRNWPRTPETDPYQAGLERLGGELTSCLRTSAKVYLAYNEFCAPSVDQAVERAVQDGAHEVLFLTTMVTPGGSHSERDIPEAVERLRVQCPGVTFTYAWPYRMEALAAFMADHVRETLGR